jgi:exodeoxyribonuclease VII large subunit
MNEIRLSVSEFNNIININLNSLGEFVVEGEITQMSISSKGGVNIVMKDSKQEAILSLSGFAPRIQGLGLIKEGMQVAVWGVPQIWSPAGKFSLGIFKVLPLGEGALREAYEILKLKLQSEGLFDEARKRSLPRFITKIALLTGKDSAAQSDFLKILQENKSGIEIDFFPVQVQGKHALKEISEVLISINSLDYDCIVLTRGGGSLEDLITFNEESLARIIFASKTPVIVGVGHEKDESIADFVADIRASTPSQAAYYLINCNNNFINGLNIILENVNQSIIKIIYDKEIEVNRKLDRLYEKSTKVVNYLNIAISKLIVYMTQVPEKINMIKNNINILERLLKANDPKLLLAKGYSIIQDDQGKIIKSINNLSISQHLYLKVLDGEIDTKIQKINKLSR